MNSRWLRLFGPIQVEDNGSTVEGFRSLKALALLGYLAVEGRPVSRPVLAGLFWGEATEEQARRELRRVLHNLSERLAGCLHADRKVVQFQAGSSLQVDVLQFGELVTQGDLAGAVELFRGDFMEGLFLDDCPEFEAWLLVQREGQRQQVAGALDALVARHQAEGDFQEALTYARQLLELDNWREETHREVMLLLARTGQISASLRQYEQCRLILVEELGVTPSQQTEELHRRIRALRSGDKLVLPHSSGPLIGRQESLADIGRLLAQTSCRLLTLLGPGGVGKTGLAVQASRQAAEKGIFLEGVYFVRLAGLESADFLLSAIIESLPLLSVSDDATEQLQNYLRDKELLLVLDNFEHLLPEGKGLLLALLRQAPELKMLITSRSRLNMPQEWLYEVTGLAITGRSTGQPGPESAASQLFWQCARQAGSNVVPSAADQEQAEKICRAVEGLPLAIELSAAWMRVFSPAEIAAELVKNLDFLASPGNDETHRHQNLHAVFDQSWKMLSAEEQSVFRSLSVFRGGFDRLAAEQVAGASPQVLRALLDNSFLQRDGASRYDIHELLRHNGLGKLEKAGESGLTRKRHAIYFMELAEEAEIELFGGPNQAARMDQFEAELDNIRATLDWSMASDAEVGLRLAAALGHFWHLRGHHAEGRRWLAQFLERSNKIDTGLDLYRAKALDANGFLALVPGSSAEFYALTSESVALWRRVADKSRLPRALTNNAVATLYGTQDVKLALELGLEGAALARKLEDDLSLAFALFGLGHIYYLAQDYERAAQNATESIALFRAVGDVDNLGGPVSTLGRIAFDRGEYGAAVTHFQESIDLFQSLDDKAGVAIALRALHSVFVLLGAFDRAEEILWDDVEIRRLMGDPTYGAYRRLREAEIALGREDFSTARDHSKRSAELWRDYDDREWENEALVMYARALEALGDETGALEAYQQVKDAGSIYSALLPALAGLARLSLAERDSAAALAHVEDILGRMATNPPNGKDDPLPVYLTCYRVLQVCDDGRALDLLKTAHDLIQDRAATIKDQALEKSFLSLPAQRDILAEASEA